MRSEGPAQTGAGRQARHTGSPAGLSVTEGRLLSPRKPGSQVTQLDSGPGRTGVGLLEADQTQALS